MEGIYRLLLSEEKEPVNVGNPEEVSILEFAREVVALTGSKSGIIEQPLPQDDPKIRQPDITKARAKLNWEPRVKRADGLARTLAYFQGRVAEQAAREAAGQGDGASVASTPVA